MLTRGGIRSVHSFSQIEIDSRARLEESRSLTYCVVPFIEEFFHIRPNKILRTRQIFIHPSNCVWTNGDSTLGFTDRSDGEDPFQRTVEWRTEVDESAVDPDVSAAG